MIRKRTNSRHLSVEYLDRRDLLTGNCVVDLDGGELTIDCDNAGNQVKVAQVGSALVIGSNIGTTFNGDNVLTMNDPVDKLTINTNNGDDDVLLSDLAVDEVFVNTGNGSDDIIAAAFFQSTGDLTVDAGNGDDNIGLLYVGGGGGDVALLGGRGDDCISANSQFSFLQSLLLDGGKGNDIGGSTSPLAVVTNIETIDPFRGI